MKNLLAKLIVVGGFFYAFYMFLVWMAGQAAPGIGENLRFFAAFMGQ